LNKERDSRNTTYATNLSFLHLKIVNRNKDAFMMVGRFMKSRSDTRKVNTMALSNLSKIRASLADDDELESDIMTPAVNEYQSEQVALYVSQMVGEMAAMARSARLDLLAYFLEMARIEATARSGKVNDPH